MNALDLLFPVSILALAALWVGGIRSHRTSTLPSGFWPLGWFALLGVGIWEALSPIATFEFPRHFLAAAFPFLMAAGAYQYADRRPPTWLLPAAIAAGLARALAAPLGVALFAAWIEMFLDVGMLLLAARVAYGARVVSASNRAFVVVSLCVLAVAEGGDALGTIAASGIHPQIDWKMWVVVGVGCAAVQLIATMDRLRLHAQSYATELEERTEYLQAVLSSLGDTRVVTLDRDARVREILGAPGDPIIAAEGERALNPSGPSFLDRMGAARARKAVSAVFATGRPEQLELRVRLDGGERFLAVSLSPVRNLRGEITEVVGAVHDLTEREAGAQALRASEERLRVILEALSFNPGIVTLNRKGEIVEVVGAPKDGPPDPRGLKASETEGVSIARFLGGPDLDSMQHAIDSVFAGAGSVQQHVPVELPAGERHFDISLRPLHGADGEVEFVMAVCTDVSERVRAEQERLAFEQRSLEAQKLESLGVLAGGIAHDFNNLLSGIVGNAELALEDTTVEGEEIRPLLAEIHRAGERAAELTTQLLAYAGKARFSRSSMHLPTLVEEMASLLRASLPAGVHLDFESHADDAWVEGDATQVRQLVMNLITNAAQALEGDPGRVSIGLDVRDFDPHDTFPVLSGSEPLPFGSYVILSVHDTGIGMDEQTQARVFEPFFTTKFEGSGLGLSAALGVVRRHEGSLRVDTKPGQGTLFEVLLPRAAAPSKAAGVPDAPRVSPRRSTGTVLVVDDDDGVRSVAARMLEREGFRAYSARSRTQALALFDAYRSELDAVLVDLTMPDCSGVDLAAELVERAGPDVPLPVLYMSGHSADDSGASSSRVRPFLQKPFSRRELAQAFQELLDD